MTVANQSSALRIPAVNDGGAAAIWRDSVQWLADHGLQILIACAIGTGIVFALLAIRKIGMKLCQQTDHTGWRSIIGRAVAKTGTIFMILVAAKLLSGYAQTPPLLGTTINFLFTIVAVFQGAVWLREIVLGVVEHRAGADAAHAEALGNAMGIIRLLVTVILFAVALILVLDNLGVNVTGLVAGLGVGGIAIGLAAQGIFSDLFAALSILFDKPFRRGDAVRWDTTSGTVEQIGLKSTRVRAITGEEVIISNTNLLGKELHNMARLERRRIIITLGLVYRTPVEVCERVPAILREIVESCEKCVLVRAGLRNFATSSLDFELQYDVRSENYDVVYQAQHNVNVEILRRFNAEGIEFAFPTQTSMMAAPDGRMIMPYPEEEAPKQEEAVRS